MTRNQRKNSEIKIIEAAERVFAKKGLNGARVREIADRAQVNPALINYYFQSKENLYKTIIEDFFQRMQRLVFPIMEQDLEPKEKLRQLIVSGVDFLAENEHTARILLREFVDKGELATELVTKHYLRNIFGKVDQFVFSKVGKKRGPQSLDVHLLFSILGAMFLYYINGPLIKEIWKRDIFSKKMIEERKEALVNLIFYGICDKLD